MAEAQDTAPAVEQTNSAPRSDVPSLNEALGTLQSELLRLKGAAEHIEQSKEAAREAVESARHVGEAAVTLAGPTQTLVDRLDKVDFPSRLDKLDATVSALQTGFQNVQGRLDGLERNLKDDLRNVGTGIEGLGKSVDAKANELTRTIAQHAENQAEAIKQLRLLLFAALAGLIVLLALLLLQ